MSRNYNVLVENPEDPMFGAALRGIFIIDGEGKLRSMQINDDAVGRSVDETIRLIKAFNSRANQLTSLYRCFNF